MFIKLTRPFIEPAEVFVRVSAIKAITPISHYDYSKEDSPEIFGSVIELGNYASVSCIETPQQVFALIEAATVSGQFVQGASL